MQLSKIPRRLKIVAVSMLVIVVAFSAVVIRGTDSTSLDEADLTLFEATDDAQIERGKYVALAGNCASCHTSDGGAYMAGGLGFETPFGRIYSTNITPDADSGIGNWSGLEFLSSMRLGVRPGGEHLYPVFPYTAFTRVTDEDVAALFAYLRSIPAVRSAPPENALSFPFNIRSLMVFWKSLFFDAGVFAADASKSAEWNRGAYLVESLTHCGACHSPRNYLGAESASLAMTGGEYAAETRGGTLRPWSAPDLTSAESGLGIWPHAEISAYLQTGRNEFVETFGPMNEVVMNSTRHLRDSDVDAMATYLKSLPSSAAENVAAVGGDVLGMGRTLYNLHCGTCHLPTGLGDPEVAPRLGRGSLVVRARNPASLINVILDGPEPPASELPPKWRKPMEDFRYILDDEEIAALASYVRNSWGNRAGEVSANQVAEQR